MNATAEQTAEITRSPEWMRPPVKGHDPIFGLSRPYYYQLIQSGAIRSVAIRKPNCATGIRLINVQSVRDWIAKQAEG